MRCLRRHLPLLVLVALCVAAAPAAGARVTVQSPDGGEHPIEFADLAAQADVHGAVYPLRAADGSTQDVAVATGFTLGALLREAGTDLDAFTYLEIPRADGTSVLVLRDQLLAADVATQPVVWEDADGLHLLRPPSGEGDVNADDLVTPLDGALLVRARSGDPLGVRIDATPLRVRPRQRVSFAAVLVAGARPGVEFSWYFDDGAAGASGAEVTHSFARAGTYNVLVNVSEGGRQLDVYDVATVVVAAPRKQPAAGGRGGSRGQGGQGSGSGGGSGTGSGSGSGSGSGAGTGSGGSGSGSGAGSGDGGGTTAPPTSPPPAVSPSPPKRPARAHPKPRRSPKPAPPATAEDDTVSGTLLASADSSPLAALASGRRSSVARAEPKRPLQIPMGAWVAAGVALLVAAGWLVEGRRTLPYWQEPDATATSGPAASA